MSLARKFEEEIVSPIHGSITPVDVRENNNISAKIVSTDPNFRFSKVLQVWKLSPLGVELISDGEMIIRKGIPVDLELQVGFHTSVLSGLIVDNVVEQQGRHILHIRLTPQIKERVESFERRKSNRWICSEDYYPTAVTSNPVLFNDFIYFTVRDISFGGMQLQTSLRNKFIMPGMIFKSMVTFPMISQVEMKLEIKSVRVDMTYGKEVLVIGATFDTTNKEVIQSVGQYLLQFSSATSLKDLRQDAFFVESIAEAVQFSYVRTKEEYEQVLKLRFESYALAGKIREGATYLDMSDEYDSRARIVIGRYKGEVIASARLIFNRFSDSMEQEKFIKWPSEFPRRDEMVEIMRACTHHEFRRSDLLISMYKFIAITVAQSKRKWIVICATDEMVPLYEKIGFHKVGLDYAHTGLNNLKHNVLLANVPHAMEGKTVGPLVWNLVWADVSSYLEQYGLIEPEPMTYVRLAIFRALKPLAQLMMRWKRRQKWKKKEA